MLRFSFGPIGSRSDRGVHVCTPTDPQKSKIEPGFERFRIKFQNPQKLSQQKISAFGGQLKLITDVSQFPNGVYTIEFVVNNSKLHKRVIISR